MNELWCNEGCRGLRLLLKQSGKRWQSVTEVMCEAMAVFQGVCREALRVSSERIVAVRGGQAEVAKLAASLQFRTSPKSPRLHQRSAQIAFRYLLSVQADETTIVRNPLLLQRSSLVGSILRGHLHRRGSAASSFSTIFCRMFFLCLALCLAVVLKFQNSP